MKVTYETTAYFEIENPQLFQELKLYFSQTWMGPFVTITKNILHDAVESKHYIKEQLDDSLYQFLDCAYEEVMKHTSEPSKIIFVASFTE